MPLKPEEGQTWLIPYKSDKEFHEKTHSYRVEEIFSYHKLKDMIQWRIDDNWILKEGEDGEKGCKGSNTIWDIHWNVRLELEIQYPVSYQ